MINETMMVIGEDVKKMYKKWSEKYNVCERILLVFVFIAGVFLRVLLTYKHFTHYDDIGLITSLLQFGDRFIERLKYRELGWTYAPFQVAMISLLINKKWGYTGNIILGRLPSLFFSIVNLLLFLYLLDKKCKNKFALFFSIYLILFSWENIIYAAQAEPYSICVTAMLLCLILYLRIIEDKDINIVLTGFICAWSCYASYQMFVYIFAFYVSIFFFFLFKKNISKVRGTIFSGCLTFILCVPLIINFFRYHLLSRSVNWNQGDNGQFLFCVDNAENKLLYFLSFFIRNTVIFFRSFFVYYEQGLLVNVLSIFIFLATVIGLIYLHHKEKWIAIFIDGCYLTTFVMILSGRLTYSPSRHLLVIEPIIIFLFAVGISYIFNKDKTFIIKLLYIGTFLSAIFIFVLNFHNEFELRKNRISEYKVYKMVHEYEPALIMFYGNTFDLDLMEIENYDAILSGGYQPQCIKKCESEIKSGEFICFFSRARKLNAEDFAYLEDAIGIGNKELELVTIDEYFGDIEVEYARGEFDNDGNNEFFYLYKIN